MCADVSRRAALLERDLAAGAVRPRALGCGCRPTAARRPPSARDSGDAPVLADYGALGADPSPGASLHATCSRSTRRPRRETSEALRCSAGGGPAFLHLGLRRRRRSSSPRAVLEHEHALRPHLDAIYRALAALGARRMPRFRAALLEGDGRHPRGAAVAGRCLRVLDELDLARFERSSGTVRCTITNGKRVELERSETFRACSAAALKRDFDS